MRPPKVRWDKWRQCWRSDVGPIGESGRRKSVYFRAHDRSKAGERAAQRELREYLEHRDEAEAAARVDAQNPTVKVCATSYIQACWAKVAQDERAARTCQSHAERLERWLALPDPRGRPYHARLIRSLTADDGDWTLSRLREDGCGPVRVAGIWRSVQAMLNWAVARVPGREPARWLAENPFANIRLGTIPQTRRTIPSPREIAALLRRAWRSKSSRYARSIHATCLLVRIQYHTGCRPGELCGATWSDWQPTAWRDEQGHAWGALTFFGKTSRKTGRDRVILVPPALARALERLRGAAQPTTHIFRREDRGRGGKWTAVELSRWVRRHRRAAQLPDHIVLYSNRAGWYTQAVDAGVSADQAGAVGGTSGDVVRSVYYQRRIAALGEVAARVRESRRKR